MEVYKAINAVQSDLARAGISKDSTNTFDNYKFRGIDAVYNALSPLLAKHGLCILPRMISRMVEEHASKNGGTLFYVTVEAEFDLVSSADGSKHTVRTFGEAMDRGDKGTNKAMSAAYKYAAFQTFAIPTEGDNDADASSHEVASSPKKRTGVAADLLAVDPIDPEDEPLLRELAREVEAIYRKSGPLEAVLRLSLEKLENNQRVFIAQQWDSAMRRAIKEISIKQHEKEPA